MIFFAISRLKQARGRSIERSRAEKRPVSALYEHFSVENDNFSSIRYPKRARKSTQLAQLDVYEDEIRRQDSPESDASNESTPVEIRPYTGKIWPHISVEIPKPSQNRPNSIQTTSQKGNRKFGDSLSSIALNGVQKAPKIPQNWLKNQPNDHTSKFLFLFLNVF